MLAISPQVIPQIPRVRKDVLWLLASLAMPCGEQAGGQARDVVSSQCFWGMVSAGSRWLCAEKCDSQKKLPHVLGLPVLRNAPRRDKLESTSEVVAARDRGATAFTWRAL